MENQPPPPYGQPPPPYAPSPYAPQSPSSPNVYGQYPQSPRPIVAAPAGPKKEFLCCEYMIWVKTLCVVLAVSAFITLIYFISTFTSYGVKNPDFNNDRCQLYNKRISRVGPKDVNDLTGYNMEDHLVCGAGPWGSFGWLLPMIVILVFDVSNAYFLKKPIGFRVSAILWSILGALALFTLVTISLLIWIIWAKLWQYSDTLLIIIVLWIFSVPAIVIIGLYAYSLFKCVQILLLEQTQAIVTPVQS